jgi:hypothetical protein
MRLINSGDLICYQSSGAIFLACPCHAYFAARGLLFTPASYEP